GTNNTVAAPTSTYMAGRGYMNTATGFHKVYAYSNSASDVSHVNGKGSFLDVTATVAELSGPGYYIELTNFPTVWEFMTFHYYNFTASNGTLQLFDDTYKLIDSGVQLAEVGT